MMVMRVGGWLTMVCAGLGGQASIQEVVNLRITTASALLLRELAAIHRSDAALIVSDFEKELLVRQVRR